MIVSTDVKICLLVFTTSVYYINVASGQVLLEFASKLCPTHNFCSINSSEVLDKQETASCCTDCSCRTDCWRTGNCCFDKENKTAQAPDLICESTMVKEGSKMPSLGEANGLLKGIWRYFVKSECPNDQSTQHLHQACAAVHVTTLEDLIWVSDATSGVIYKNRRCAECNGIQNWTSWNVRTFCRDILNANLSNIADVLLTGDCGIVNEPPDDEEERAMNWQCYEPQVTVCNGTGLWKQHDPDIEAACLSYNIPYFKGGKVDQPIVIYKNLFCLICNNDNVDDLCHLLSTPKTSTTSFSALIDFQNVLTMEKPESKCSQEEIFDKYQGECRSLLCPFGAVSYYGDCKPLAQILSNLGVLLIFHLRVDWEKSNVSSEMEHLSVSSEDGDTIIERFVRHGGFKKCSHCTTSLFMDGSVPADRPLRNFNIFMEFQTNHNCQLDYVYTKLQKVIDSNIKIETSDVLLTLSVELNTRSPQEIISNKATPITGKAFGFPRPCDIDIQITRLPCPEIRISYKESLDIFGEKRTSNTHNIRHDMLTDEVFVCVEDFFKEMETTGSEGHVVAVSHLAVLLMGGTVFHLW